MAQPKMLQKERRRAVEQRPPESFGAPGDVDEPTLMQGFEHAPHLHTADLFDLDPADGLAVRDDRQCFERRRGKPVRSRRQLRAFDRLRVLRPRQDLPAAADLHQLDAVAIDVVVLVQFVERRLHRGR